MINKKDNDLSFFSFTRAAINYAWRQLAQRAGFPDEPEPVDLHLQYGNSLQPIRSPALIIYRTGSADWADLLKVQKTDLRWFSASDTIPAGAELPFTNPVPVLFWGEGIDRKTKPMAEKLPDGSVIFYADIIATALFMLSRWEETVIPERDRHGRFPASASTACKLGFLDIPLVDQYALILREWIRVLVPNWSPKTNVPAVNLTHDIDHVYQYSNLLSFAGGLANTVSSGKPFTNFGGEFSELRTQFFRPEQGRKYRAVFDLAKYSARHGFKSRFYFMSARPSLKQQGYDPALPWLQRGYGLLREEGHEIGFHPGYETFQNPKLLQWEKQRLEKASGLTLTGGRQHFLRFKVPDTWRAWKQAGLHYDSTLGFADHEGFRCGTCHPFKPFDLENDSVIDLLEIPLIVMDGTLINYRKLAVEEAGKSIMALANRCVEVEGIFTLLWHNTMLLHRDPAWVSLYSELLPSLKDLVARS